MKNKFVKGLCIALAVIVIFGVAGAVVTFTKNDTKKVSSLEFSRGGLNSVTGEYEPTKQSVYTKDAFECIGLRVEPDFESTVTYDVYYYDKDDTFIEAKLGLKGIYDEDFPLAQYARIVIHPEIPEDEDEDEWEIGLFNAKCYAKNLKITVDKVQEYKYADLINIYDASISEVGKAFPVTNNNIAIDNIEETPAMTVSGIYNLDESVDMVDVYLYLNPNTSGNIVFGIFDEEGKIVFNGKGYAIRETKFAADIDKPCWIKISLNLDGVDAENLRLRGHFPSDVEKIYIFSYND